MYTKVLTQYTYIIGRSQTSIHIPTQCALFTGVLGKPKLGIGRRINLVYLDLRAREGWATRRTLRKVGQKRSVWRVGGESYWIFPQCIPGRNRKREAPEGLHVPGYGQFLKKVRPRAAPTPISD